MKDLVSYFVTILVSPSGRTYEGEEEVGILNGGLYF